MSATSKNHRGFADVRAKVGGLKGVITKLNDAPDHEHKWGSFPKCPFCGGKSCSGVFTKGPAEFFKCHHSDCSTGGTVMTEVGYIAAREGLSDSKPAGGGPSEAYKRLLEMAGMWEEPSVGSRVSGARGGVSGLGSRVSGGAKAEASGGGVASRAQDPKPKMPDPGPDDLSGAASPVVPMAASPAETQDASASGAAPDVSPSPAPVRRMPGGDGASTAGPHLQEGQAGAAHNLGSSVLDLGSGDGEVRRSVPVLNADHAGPLPLSGFKISGEEAAKFTDEDLQAHLAKKALADKARDRAREEVAASPDGINWGEAAETADEPARVVGDDVAEALRWFYDALASRPCGLFTEADSEKLWLKRGLAPETCRVAGFASNARGNLKLLLEMESKFPRNALVQSGLWSRQGMEDWVQSDAEAGVQTRDGARPSEFYYGKGLAGERWDNERKEKVAIYDFNDPVLIPYFEQCPGADGVAPVSYAKAIVTEGEFKANALWQVFAGDARLVPSPSTGRLIGLRPHKLGGRGVAPMAYITPGGGPLGVAALPGIWFWKRTAEAGGWLVQQMLRLWLRRTGVREVMIGYDHEEKKTKSLDRAHDSVIAGLLLGRDLADELGVTVRFMLLPTEWRDLLGGKADWDGVLAKMLALGGPREWGGAMDEADAKRREGSSNRSEGGSKRSEAVANTSGWDDGSPVAEAPEDLEG